MRRVMGRVRAFAAALLVPAATSASPALAAPIGSGGAAGVAPDAGTAAGTAPQAGVNRAPRVGSRRRRPFKRIWIGASVELELMGLPSVHDVCALDPATGLPSHGHGLYCTTLDGADFPARSVTLENTGLCTAARVAAGLCPADAGGRSAAGLARGNLRVMGSFDYAISANLLIGARLGSTLFPYPGRAAVNDGRDLGSRFYGELRGTWVFGANAIGSPGLKPLLLVGAGVAAFDAHSTSAAAFCPTAQPVASGKPCPVPLFAGKVEVWQTGGPAFGTLGLGLRWLATPAMALMGAVRANLSFHGNGGVPSFVPFVSTFGPELGVQYGF